MCTVCGCGSGEVKIGAKIPGRTANAKKSGPTRAWRPIVAHEYAHQHLDGTHHAHTDEHAPNGAASDHHGDDLAHVLNRADQAEQHVSAQAHADAHGHVTQTVNHLHFGAGPAHAHVPGLSQSQMIRIEQDILGKNDGLAAHNRRAFAARGIFTLNLVSSPGSGKTTLLVRTIRELAGSVPVAVIEGDQQTEFDAERIRETGAPALQINTGKGCHLDADMVGRALKQLNVADNSLLLIENVGNLVCPAAFDLGEAHKVAILSVTEGEDKPLKYPDMFAAADLMLLNKIDLLPYLSFDVARAIDFARRVNPRLEVIQVSATNGAGMADWLAWIQRGLACSQIASEGRGA